MTSEEFFRRLFEDRDYTPADFPESFWQHADPHVSWLEHIDQRIGIWDPELVLEMPHRADQWATIHALRAAGFGFNLLASPVPRHWLGTGTRTDGATGPYWSAAIHAETRSRGPDYYSAEVAMRTQGPCNHRVEWGAIGDTPSAALEGALVRARDGVAALITMGAP